MSEYHVVVIGAGQAGLSSSFQLQERGIPHIVLERNEPGNTWITQRWDTFMLNTLNRFTAMPAAELGQGQPEAFESPATLVKHFNGFIDQNELPVRSGSDVEAVMWSSEDMRFHVKVAGDADHIKCAAIICATGSQNLPKIPIVANHLPDGVVSMHAADYRNSESLPAGSVLVVGSAQTGVQVTEDLVAADRSVYLSTSRVGRVPRRYRGEDITHWFDLTGFYANRPADLEDPNEMRAVQPQVSGTQGGHTVSLQGLAQRGVKLLGRLEIIEDGIAQFRDNLRENIEFGDKVSEALKTRMDAGITAMGLKLSENQPDPEDDVDETAYEIAAPLELDLAAAGITSVIWATGFTGDFSYIEIENALRDDGQPNHVDGVSPVEGLYFIGMPWLRTRASGIVHGVNDDAEFIVEQLTNQLQR